MKTREAALEDLPAVSELMRGVGWHDLTHRRWERDWDRNPALASGDPPVSRGWVLENDGRILGFLGNLIQLFDWEGRSLRAATIWGLVVHPEARGNSMRLVRAFTGQENVDLLFATTATLHVPEILGLLKYERLPVADFDVGLYWVAGARGLIGSALRRKGVPAGLAAAAGAILGPALRAETRLRRRWPRATGGGVDVETLAPQRAGDEFDELWRRKRAEGSKLAVVRSSAVLRWHFDAEGWAVPPVLLAARRAGGLVGYAALVRSDKPENGLERWQVADLIALRDEPAVVDSLLAAAYAHAVADGAHMLEVFGCPGNLRGLVEASGPRRWKRESWPYLYKANDPVIHEALRSPERWYPTLMDGDGCLPII